MIEVLFKLSAHSQMVEKVGQKLVALYPQKIVRWFQFSLLIRKKQVVLEYHFSRFLGLHEVEKQFFLLR